MNTELWQHVERIFQAASDLPAEQRAAFLDEECDTDPQLRTEVESLLVHHDNATESLSRPAMELAGDPSKGDPRIGSEIGPFHIKRLIAAGGMGSVYEATQKQPRRSVALKLMNHGIASPSALRRFEFEAQLLARLRHPGIAQVYEAGTHDDGAGGVPYFAMEYLPNARPITEYADEKKLSTRQRLELFIQVCDAVHHGHQKGIIHRDLKPTNILVDSSGQPKIIDFGVARSTDSDMAVTTLQTSVGELIGTLQYMSPEQCAADPHDLDTRSDVYTLGVIAYELLAARLPYQVSRAQIYEATRMIREQPPEKLSTIDRTLRGDLETIVLKALDKERARRYQSAVELAQDLQRYLNHESIHARPPSIAYQVRTFARRNKAVVTGLLAVIAVLIAGTFVSTFFALQASNQARVAKANAQQANENAAQLKKEKQRADHQTAEANRHRGEAEYLAYTAILAAGAVDLERNDTQTLRHRLEQAPVHLRGWEWDYLWNESDRSLETPIQLPAASAGYNMSLSDDGTLLAVRVRGSHDKPVKLHDTRSGDEIATLQAPLSNSPRMTISADKKLLAYSHWGMPGIQVYEITTGRALVPENLQWTYHCFLGFHPQDPHAYVISRDGKLRVMESSDWSEIAVLPGTFPTGSAATRPKAALSPDGKLLVVGAYRPASDGERWQPMRVYDIESRELVKEISEPRRVVALRFNEDASALTTLADDGILTVYTVRDWKKAKETREDLEPRGSLAIHHLHGQPLTLSFDDNGSVAVFNHRLARVATLRGHAGAGTSIAIDSDHAQIVTAHADGAVRRWDLYHPRDLQLPLGSIAVSADGSVALGGMEAHDPDPAQVCTVDMASGEVLAYLRWYPVTSQHASYASSVAYSPDGRRAAVASASLWDQGRWRIYDLWTGLADHEESTWDDKEFPWMGDLLCIDWSADGRWIAVGGVRDKRHGERPQGRVRIHDAHTYRIIAELDDHQAAVTALCFSHDGRRLITAANDGMLRAWQVPDGELIWTIGQLGDPPVKCLALAPDGTYFAAGLADGTVAAWTIHSKDLIFQSQIHGAEVSSVAFHPNGSRLATVAADRSVKIVDPESCRELLMLRRQGWVRAVRFSPDGKRLAIAGQSLAFLDTVNEMRRSDERRKDREARQRAHSVIQNVLADGQDPLVARERLLSHPSLDEATRGAAIRELQRALESYWKAAYQYDELADVMWPRVARHVLRQGSLVTKQEWIEIDSLVKEVKALPDVEKLRHQALIEFAITCQMGFADTRQLAQRMALAPHQTAEDYGLAYFGIQPLIRQNPRNGHLQGLMALVAYRAGLLRDALESAERSNSLYRPEMGPIPHNLAVMAMSLHRMGRADEASAVMTQLDELMEQPTWKANQDAAALCDEARQIVQKPVTEPWDETAAWHDCKTHLEKLNLDTADYARWLRHTADLLGHRKLEKESLAWRHDAIDLYRQLVKSDPESPAAHRGLGLALTNQARYDEAVSVLRQAVTLQPNDPDYLVSLADALRRAGQIQEAVSVVEQSLRIDADHVTSLVQLGGLQRELGNLEKSREALKRAIELDQHSQSAKKELQLTQDELASDLQTP